MIKWPLINSCCLYITRSISSILYLHHDGHAIAKVENGKVHIGIMVALIMVCLWLVIQMVC